ncbi:MAG TPA: hypothetical protein VEO54_14170 [Thermoanaerobaculia bacterium]|nr:hypothetical protein [Thermoanaerobaculia bacterium]
MTELESVRLKKEKRQAKSTAKKSRVLKVIGLSAAGAAAVGVARHAFQKRASASRIIIPDNLPVSSGEKIGASAHRKLIGIVKDGLLPSEVADLLATTATSITRRIRARKLYAIPFAHTWVLPKFQFHRGRLLRGIDDVLPRLNPGLHPLEVINWFSIPNADLVMEGETVSPTVWLARGGDIASVAELAGEVGNGL